MDSNAAGQFLGYVLQIPRALFYLLKAGPGDVVCVEVVGDVALLAAAGHIIAEEDKSSVNTNPLTNKSKDLWKTFYNWITAINNHEISIHNASFLLFCNKTGRPGIVNTFHSARNEQEALKAISEAQDLLTDVGQGHEIWRHYNYVVNQHAPELAEVIQRFEFQTRAGAGYEDVREELIKKHLNTNDIPYMVTSLSGWLQQELTERIAAKKPARIEWEDFDKQVKVLFSRARRLELIDFTQQEPVEDKDIQQQMKIRPCYLKQLEAIDCDVDEILNSVADFLMAKVNRDKWIANGCIDEAVAKEFQATLMTYWSNQKKRIEITETGRTEKEQGQLLLSDCKNRQATIRDSHPPSGTIAGTYHALADEPSLGWHPHWKLLFQERKDG